MNQPASREAVTDVVELRIPAKAEWVSIARLAVSAVASRLQFSIEEIEDVKLAVAEALVSSIARGGSRIDIICESLADGLRIRVRNFGVPEQPEVIDVASVDESAASSLGVFLIRALMDTVDYDARAEGGSDLVMFKRLPA
ncbi:MAG TPA: ATP-binding protein [Candidatus Tyrphobacter sp.]